MSATHSGTLTFESRLAFNNKDDVREAFEQADTDKVDFELMACDCLDPEEWPDMPHGMLQILFDTTVEDSYIDYVDDDNREALANEFADSLEEQLSEHLDEVPEYRLAIAAHSFCDHPNGADLHAEGTDDVCSLCGSPTWA